jgi:hypothetical protein
MLISAIYTILFTGSAAYNFARGLKTLNGSTAYEYLVKCWQNDKERFKVYPNHDTLGLNI